MGNTETCKNTVSCLRVFFIQLGMIVISTFIAFSLNIVWNYMILITNPMLWNDFFAKFPYVQKYQEDFITIVSYLLVCMAIVIIKFNVNNRKLVMQKYIPIQLLGITIYACHPGTDYTVYQIIPCVIVSCWLFYSFNKNLKLDWCTTIYIITTIMFGLTGAKEYLGFKRPGVIFLIIPIITQAVPALWRNFANGLLMGRDISLEKYIYKSLGVDMVEEVNDKIKLEKDGNKYVFISYSSKHQQVAEDVRMLLKDNEIDCWMATYDIPSGSEYPDVINEALENCSCLLLLLTEAAQESPFVYREVERAVTYKKHVIPMQLEDFELRSGFKFLVGCCQITSVSEICGDNPKFMRVISDIKEITKSN